MSRRVMQRQPRKRLGRAVRRQRQRVTPRSGGVLKSCSADVFRERFDYPGTMAFCALNARMPRVFPDAIRVKLAYTYNWSDATADPGFLDQIFRGNDLYQPKNSGATSQPRYYDQLVGGVLYRRYHVLGSAIHVEFKNNVAGAARIVIYPSTVTTSFTNAPEAAATRRAVARVADEATSSKGLLFFRSACATLDMYSIEARDKDMGAVYTTSPTTIWYWHVVTQPFPTSGVAADFDVRVVIIYDAILFGPGFVEAS